jgi:hypothetical protein
MSVRVTITNNENPLSERSVEVRIVDAVEPDMPRDTDAPQRIRPGHAADFWVFGTQALLVVAEEGGE